MIWPTAQARAARARAAALIAGAPLLAVQSCAAPAHLFIGDGGPGAGFIHPLTGPDHLLAMFTIGLLSARLGGRAIWTVPAAFLAGMTTGGVIALSGGIIRGTEWGIAWSVVLLGLMLTFAEARLGALALFAAALFGLFHGYAHGIEMPRAAAPALYALGFLAATAGLHVMGALTGLLVECRPRSTRRLRAAGAIVALAGVAFVAEATVQGSPRPAVWQTSTRA